jgi:hypothetical protein
MLQCDSRFGLGVLVNFMFESPTSSAISFGTFFSSAKGTFAETSNNTRAGLLERAGSFQRSTVRPGPPDTLMFFHT